MQNPLQFTLDPSLRWSYEGLLIRPCLPEDSRGIAKLAAKVFAESRPVSVDLWEAEWNWKFNGEHLGLRGASVATDANGEIVGHYGSLIRRFQIGRSIVWTGVPVDNMVAEPYRGGRLQMKLFKHQETWARMEGTSWGIGAPNPAAYVVGKRLLGYRNLTSMKILRANLASAARRGFWRMMRWRAGWRHPRGARVRVVPEFDRRFEPLWERYRGAYTGVEERTLAWLRWRFGPGVPGRSYTILALESATGDEILRYAVIRRPDPGDGTWMIVDLFGSTDAEDLRALAEGIVQWAGRNRAEWLEVRLAAPPDHFQALLRAGFYWEGNEQPVVFWVFDPKKVKRRLVEEPTHWYVTEAFHDTQ